jgi:predicted transcriptional regulator YdeE
MEKVFIEGFMMVGISVRTTNANSQAMTDIAGLWARFSQENILTAIPNKVSDNIYSIYTAYEGDHTQPYTTIIGCKVENLKDIPDGMVGLSIEDGQYLKITAKGDMTKGMIAEEWYKIWAMDIARTYKADYELYGLKAQNPLDAEVDIFIGIQ